MSIAWRAPEAGTLSVAIDDAEGLPADNARFVALGSRAAPTALIIAADEPALYKAGGKPAALYVSRALATSSGEAVEVVSGRAVVGHVSRARCRTIVEWRSLSTRGLERAARERLMAYVNGGGGLFIAAAA